MAVAAQHWLLRKILYFSMTILIKFPVTFAISDSEALLKLKSSFTNASALDSWEPSRPPCDGKEELWDGLICYKGSVNGLRLGNMGLSGTIDVDALVEIRGLRSMSFINNNFNGTIPAFNRLGALKTLYLTGNQFSGEIPSDYFEKMGSLKKLWLSKNKFSGGIPSSLAKLHLLVELHLEDNEFSGRIPDFQQPLKSINLSNNKLEGEIPSGLMKFDAKHFSGNPNLCGTNVGVKCDTPSDVGSNHDKSNSKDKEDNTKYIIYGVVGVGVMLLLVAIVLIVKVRRKKKTFNVLEKQSSVGTVNEVQVSMSTRREMEMNKKSDSSRKNSTNNSQVAELVIVNDEKGVFGLPDLMKAAAEVLGNGGLGSSYKAAMANGITVVVKRMRDMNAIGRDNFDTEMRRLGSVKHRNILTPLGYHFRKDEKLLVYEYVPKGSLLYLLHGDRGPSHEELNWATRLKIIQGIARGLGHLHTELAAIDLPHGDLRSSNILLGPNYEPLLSEYGFITLVNNANRAQSLFAYKAPEAILTGKASPKCDVYCLGVVILEILTGKYPSQYLNNDKGGTDIVRWVNSAVADGNVLEMLDPQIANTTNSLGDMEQLLRIGVACAESNPQTRLDIREAVRKIEEIQSPENQDSDVLHTNNVFGSNEASR